MRLTCDVGLTFYNYWRCYLFFKFSLF